ncbi:MAG: hypothetical protein GAK35_02206 [Herbaspirillum frisingense]|uniref:Uncharacterized protein n=1 Tax=Herbaspirillum frisingense TaxID=92645 RepID=A0A7V8JU93_9BURK|nr:MAG: hypothetical protein GAK35_02206 [Herbaspirillum frisingense]
MSKASADLLSTLHNAVTVELLRRIADGEASSADMGAAIKLLKDNSITAEIGNNSALSEMEKRLEALRARRGGKPVAVPTTSAPVSPEEVDDALANAMSRQNYGS